LLLGVLEQVKEMKDLKNMKDMKEMTKIEKAGKITRGAAREKEGIAGSGIMNEINDMKEKSFGHGIERARILQLGLR